MVSMRKELIASLSDLEAVIVECSNQECKAQVKVPVQANLGSQRDLRLIGLIECPVCRGISTARCAITLGPLSVA
jgi:hypothetical protein